MGPNVEVIETAELGDRSYVVHDGQVAVVVDPQRDLDRVERILACPDLRCRLVLETHIHNDYVTGGFELARRSARALRRGRGPRTSRSPASRSPTAPSGEVGSLRVRAVATPGHTAPPPVLRRSRTATGPRPSSPAARCSTAASAARTSLAADRTDELTRAQFHSARRLAADGGRRGRGSSRPTGSGASAPRAPSTGGENSTMGQERRRNDALVEEDEESFVARLLRRSARPTPATTPIWPGATAGVLAAPGPVSRRRRSSRPSCARRVRAGEWVVDLRDRAAYAAGAPPGQHRHRAGPAVLATYLGWLVPWGMPVTLVGESPEQIAEAQRQLVRIGIERPAGAAVVGPPSWPPRTGRPATPARASTTSPGPGSGGGPTVLDVRREDERAAGAIPGLRTSRCTRLLADLDDAPRGRPWVHCASGYRAAIAASLPRAGRTRRGAHRRRVLARRRARPGDRLSGSARGGPGVGRTAGVGGRAGRRTLDRRRSQWRPDCNTRLTALGPRLASMASPSLPSSHPTRGATTANISHSRSFAEMNAHMPIPSCRRCAGARASLRRPGAGAGGRRVRYAIVTIWSRRCPPFPGRPTGGVS